MKKLLCVIPLISAFVGCSQPNKNLQIISAEVLEVDNMPILQICFNQKPAVTEGFISSVRVKTKDGHVFGRDDMYTSLVDQNLCSIEQPYFFLRNTRDEQYRKQFNESMKPNNIQSILIKLGTQHVNSYYSNEWYLTSYEKKF